MQKRNNLCTCAHCRLGLFRHKTHGGPARESLCHGRSDRSITRRWTVRDGPEDACICECYAMWRIEPQSRLVGFVKGNPGEHASAQFGNRGYRNAKPSRGMPVPSLRSGETHTLRAEMKKAEMKVFVDNSLLWEGPLGPEALAFDGPIGIRSNYARLQIELRAAEPDEGQRGHAPDCRSSGAESE